MPNRLKEIRTDLGIPRRIVTADLGIAESTLFCWESGYSEPNVTMIKALLKIYGVSFNEAFY